MTVSIQWKTTSLLSVQILILKRSCQYSKFPASCMNSGSDWRSIISCLDDTDKEWLEVEQLHTKLYNFGHTYGTYLLQVLSDRGVTIHVFIPNRHGTDISVWCMRPYNKYSQFTLNPEGGARSNATLFDNPKQKKRECHELCTWKQSPLDSDQVIILNASLTDRGVY